MEESEELDESSREMRDVRFRIGSTLGGRYRLHRVLGRGGGAWVFAAEHVQFPRSFALKLPHTERDYSDVLFARLHRELRALGKVRHPAVVDVVDGGEIDGLPFIAMQLLEGRTLSSLIAARNRLEADEVTKIGIELSGALAAAHAAGVVHRDVKPTNVMITRDSRNQVRLIDFGTAKLLGDEDAVDVKLTQSGSILGTLEYLAPELLLSPDAPTALADIYSLGVTLFECLTGAVPHEGTIGQILAKLSRPGAPSIRETRPDVPRPLAEIVERCLKREGQERFGSMNELLSALVAVRSRSSTELDLLRPARRNDEVRATAPGAESRREYARAPYITLARLSRANTGRTVDGRIEDISEGGVLLVADETCAQGEIVRLRVPLPVSGRVVEVPARLRWTRAARGVRVSGFEFVSLPDAARAEIRQYVSLMATR